MISAYVQIYYGYLLEKKSFFYFFPLTENILLNCHSSWHYLHAHVFVCFLFLIIEISIKPAQFKKPVKHASNYKRSIRNIATLVMVCCDLISTTGTTFGFSLCFTDPRDTWKPLCETVRQTGTETSVPAVYCIFWESQLTGKISLYFSNTHSADRWATFLATYINVHSLLLYLFHVLSEMEQELSIVKILESAVGGCVVVTWSSSLF